MVTDADQHISIFRNDRSILFENALRSHILYPIIPNDQVEKDPYGLAPYMGT